ncbi:helix-turn-helix transcriptional regulator [Aliarcobacter cryaerophilus]|jgi:predicted DNA-binding transcriptional regulator AlpA|uniref:helix-turn-helix transcriptional regulator n=1 Tax=Aliarcobacter cryaerophilus TaxID=28198 RepID=UPI0021B47411|nr:hypothetical protein [Aliarcobacter cryaerophilus]MCT7514210.1 hypothetical protein [Aliarcobacter cryaerophilus]
MEDRIVKKTEVLNEYIKIGETKLDELIKKGNFAKPIFIDGYAHALYSVKEIQQWIEEQKKKRNI